jgi:hypothetical protein
MRSVCTCTGPACPTARYCAKYALPVCAQKRERRGLGRSYQTAPGDQGSSGPEFRHRALLSGWLVGESDPRQALNSSLPPALPPVTALAFSTNRMASPFLVGFSSSCLHLFFVFTVHSSLVFSLLQRLLHRLEALHENKSLFSNDHTWNIIASTTFIHPSKPLLNRQSILQRIPFRIRIRSRIRASKTVQRHTRTISRTS